ncbi:hypothetical protein RUND412_010651 [Rhizina undulata]
MMIDGVKMACEACIRGHRVSGCNHSDRKLLPIAKKGRPVSQCTHCRHMRKSRSAHVKCDCGERLALQAKNGGKALQAVQPAGVAACHAVVAAPAGTEESGDLKAPISSLSPSCTCSVSGCCSCSSIKKEQHTHSLLDSVPELAAPATCTTTATAAETRKSRLQMTKSETSLTTFANGHHRPTHKHHNSVHGSAPYTIPHVGHTGHTFGEHNGCTKTASVSAPPTTTSQKPRRIKSEQSSPDHLRVYPALQMPNTGITPLELTPQPQHPVLKPAPVSRASGRMQPGLSVNTNHPPFTYQDFSGQELLQSADSDTAYQFSAGLYPPQSAGWPPTFGRFDNSTFEDLKSDPFEHPQSLDLEQFLRLSLPGLGNSTSGDEVDDLMPPLNGVSPLSGNGTASGVLSSGSSDQADSDNYGLSAASSYIGLQQVGLLAGTDELVIEKYLSQSIAPTPQTESFDSIISAVTGVENGRLGLYGDYHDSYLSPKEIAAKPGDTSALLVTTPQTTDDNDFIWMASWSNNVKQGPPPTDPSWHSA